MKKHKKSLKKIIKTYGAGHQLLICIEELSELIKAITKAERYPEDTTRIVDITEEIADVLICIQQLKMIYNIDDKKIKEQIKNKVKRTKNLLTNVKK